MIFKILSINPAWGNGYGNTVFKKISIWYANAQNGFWDYSINYGLIAASIFVLLVIYASSKVCSLPEKQQSDSLWVGMAAVYTYLFIGTVEVTFGTQFLYIIAMTFALCNQKTREIDSR